MEHHADFAVALTHWLWVETTVSRGNGDDTICGWAIALGWWIDPGHEGEPTGTIYPIVDERGGPPVWIAEGNIRSSRVVGAPETPETGQRC